MGFPNVQLKIVLVWYMRIYIKAVNIYGRVIDDSPSYGAYLGFKSLFDAEVHHKVQRDSSGTIIKGKSTLVTTTTNSNLLFISNIKLSTNRANEYQV